MPFNQGVSNLGNKNVYGKQHSAIQKPTMQNGINDYKTISDLYGRLDTILTDGNKHCSCGNLSEQNSGGDTSTARAITSLSVAIQKLAQSLTLLSSTFRGIPTTSVQTSTGNNANSALQNGIETLINSAIDGFCGTESDSNVNGDVADTNNSQQSNSIIDMICGGAPATTEEMSTDAANADPRTNEKPGWRDTFINLASDGIETLANTALPWILRRVGGATGRVVGWVSDLFKKYF